ncbi:MAG TPA: helix-turn-helix domain-containing protein [Lachnospiraceae bacterium]|nr:helix-turn-helix domain-containing protein [Lachnospiraceae bacterium]
MPAKKKVTKDMVLSAALELLREGGIGAVNVKALAQRLNCSTQPIYLSFPGMDELRSELTKEAVGFFIQKLQSRGTSPADLFGMSYICFAMEEKELFRYLFMRSNALSEIKEALAPMMEHSISELMAQYRISHEKADYLHDQLWMHTHGIASMIATDFCAWDTGKISQMLKDSRACFTREFEV